MELLFKLLSVLNCPAKRCGMLVIVYVRPGEYLIALVWLHVQLHDELLGLLSATQSESTYAATVCGSGLPIVKITGMLTSTEICCA